MSPGDHLRQRILLQSLKNAYLLHIEIQSFLLLSESEDAEYRVLTKRSTNVFAQTFRTLHKHSECCDMISIAIRGR